MELEVLRARPSTNFSIKFLNEQIDLLRGEKKGKGKGKREMSLAEKWVQFP
jgi:hypothetical protein